jgi:acetyl esterase/lipase
MAWAGPWWKLGAVALVVVAIGVLVAVLLARPVEERDVVYGEAGGRPLRLDIYRPSGPRMTRPGVLLIHGGGWAEGDKSSQREAGIAFTRAGYVAIAVGYRLAKDDASRYPAQVDDVRRAVRWVRAHADEVGIDPGRLGAFGASAGGHLAAILGTTDVPGPGGESSRVNCVVDCCGPSDFTDESSPALGPKLGWMVPNLFGKPRAEAPDAYKDASTVAHVDSRSAPTLIIHGSADDIVPIDQSRRLRDALARAGVEVKLVELEGEGHTFQNPGSGERLLRESLDFLGRHLKP